jgi:uncharacterized membrane protein (UPF0127 family)
MAADDDVAKGFIRRHAEFLRDAGITWHLEPGQVADEPLHYESCVISLGGTNVHCQVADTAELQRMGLSKHAELGMYDGMIFPYEKPTRVAFHMSTVRFPIDIIFVGSDGRVTNIVDDIQPGTPGVWRMPHTSAVIEVNGGFARAHSLEVGAPVALVKTGQATFPDYPRKDINPEQLQLSDGVPADERFKGHDMPDKSLDSLNYDPAHYDQQLGYDQTTSDDDADQFAPVRPAP